MDDVVFCLCDRDATPPLFGVPDFASYSNGSFTPLLLEDIYHADGPCPAMCVSGTAALFQNGTDAAPILRVPDISAALWAALLTVTEAIVFTVAALIFFLFFCISVYRIASSFVSGWPELRSTAFTLTQLCILALFCLLRTLLLCCSVLACCLGLRRQARLRW